MQRFERVLGLVRRRTVDVVFVRIVWGGRSVDFVGRMLGGVFDERIVIVVRVVRG